MEPEPLSLNRVKMNPHKSGRIFINQFLFLVLWIFTTEAEITNNLTLRLRRLERFESARGLTISGFSAGASFAHNLHIAHSKLFSGVGIFAGLYYEYGGSGSNSGQMLEKSDQPGKGVDASVQAIQNYQKQGLIDNTRNIYNQKIFVWAGDKDEMHNITERLGMIQIYEPLLSTPRHLFTKVQLALHRYPVGHCKPGVEADGYMGQCHYNGKLEMFWFFFNQEPIISENGPFGTLEEFDQTQFFKGSSGETLGMNDVGLQYIPKSCRGILKRCHIHFFFVGCTSPTTTVEDCRKTILGFDFIGIAEGTGIIFIFPLPRAVPGSKQNCFDFFGVTGPKYATKQGNQIRVVRRMIRRVTGL